jgi:aryl-alcohol dehydrogenase
MAAKILGATTIVAIDVHPGRLELSRKLGATHAISAVGHSVPEAILDQIPEGIRAVLDTTGRQSSWSDAVTYLQRGGDFAFVTTPEPVDTYGFPPFPLFLKCASLHTVLLGGANAQDTLSTIFAWYRQGEFPVDDIVRTYAFEDIELAFEHSTAGETIKPVLIMQ